MHCPPVVDFESVWSPWDMRAMEQLLWSGQFPDEVYSTEDQTRSEY